MATSVHPTMTETEYWNRYKLINDEINLAIHSFYTWLGINKIISQDKDIHQKLNSEALFWSTIKSSLQHTYFIVLGRIFDDDAKTGSIHKFLSSTVEHPEFFSKKALVNRRTSDNNGKTPEYITKQYLARLWEPTKKDLRKIEKMIRPSGNKFMKIYQPIRNKIYAHREEK